MAEDEKKTIIELPRPEILMFLSLCAARQMFYATLMVLAGMHASIYNDCVACILMG